MFAPTSQKCYRILASGDICGSPRIVKSDHPSKPNRVQSSNARTTLEEAMSTQITKSLTERWCRWNQLPALDLEQLVSSTGGDTEFAQELLEAYFSNLPGSVNGLITAIHSENCEAMKYHAHAAKGSSQAVGACRLGAIFLAMERELDGAECSEILTKLDDETQQVRNHASELGLFHSAAA
ncbi:MAG: Hpt domain-containing protein [Chlorobia bacterium]|nr:Hpt domain-containing protein [Fimbriimonadaceae bacterium]